MSVNEIRDEGDPILEENAMEMLKIEEKCNWDSLPNELKVMCIEKTDIKTRANLMLSNRHNKMLVESIKSKHQLSLVRFKVVNWFSRRQRCNKTFRFVVKGRRSTADYTSKKYEPRKLMDVLLNANIDELKFHIIGRLSETDEHFMNALATCNKMFSIKSLHLTATHRIDLEILRRCDEQLEQITLIFNDPYYSYDMRKLLGIPQVIAAKRLTIRFLKCFERLFTAIDWLIVEADHDIGKEVIFRNEEPLWQFTMTLVKSRWDFHHPTENIVCLRPLNPSKRVWAWQSREDFLINFLVSAAGSDAPNFEEIQKKKAKERKEYLLKTKL